MISHRAMPLLIMLYHIRVGSLLKCLLAVSDEEGLPTVSVAVRNEWRLGVEVLADIVDVGTVVTAVVAASGSNVRAMSLRTQRHHVLMNHPAHDRGEPAVRDKLM